MRIFRFLILTLGVLVLLSVRQPARGYNVKVHTNDGRGSPNSGPGDFPGGEIRGQL